jgi:hypothetical protein
MVSLTNVHKEIDFINYIFYNEEQLENIGAKKITDFQKYSMTNGED